MDTATPPEPQRARLVQFFVSCTVLGIGVGMLLLAALGSDGYSTLVNGVAIVTGLPFALVNILVAAGFVAIAWSRGLPPAWSTIVQPVYVGLVINGVLLIDAPHALGWRVLLLVFALPVMVVGVAGYLGSGAGAGPPEAAALSLDPPVPFRWGYSVLQGTSALIGWSLGAAFGVGTALVIFALGPAVQLLSTRVPLLLNIKASGKTVVLPTVPCEQA